jgi:predicted  nucleic acid-binding Zn-ribbon protein
MASDFQKKGAEAQKETVRGKVRDAIRTLRDKHANVSADQRTEVTLDDVLEVSNVSIKTLKRSYHTSLLADVERLLAEINVGVAIAKPTPPTRPRNSSIFRQNDELMQRVEALRHRLRTELAEKQRKLDAMTARVAQMTAEIAKLRPSRRGDRPPPPKPATRRTAAA